MLHVENARIKELALHGNIGLEKEGHRVTQNGRMARTPHPFSPLEPHITRDFSENQMEINTDPFPNAHEAVASLGEITRQVQQTLATLPEREYLWPFSNPPFLQDEKDIPIAIFEGPQAGKTSYRRYLANNYGKYKMIFSGIHLNFSFSDELLEEDFKLSGGNDFQTYKNLLYLKVAEKAAEYGWILTFLTAASPLMDASFFSKGLKGRDAFVGMGSVRCGELGYWNHFTPILDYTSATAYASSIQRYVDNGFIVAPTELYYPIRLKPRGVNSLEGIVRNGINHIELRMIDLNPLTREGLDVRDARFAQLFLVFLASTPQTYLGTKSQVRAIQNFKNAARYDARLINILLPNGDSCAVTEAGMTIIEQMKKFYLDADDEVQEVLRFQASKFLRPENRYPFQVFQRFRDVFTEKGLERAKELQEEYLSA